MKRCLTIAAPATEFFANHHATAYARIDESVNVADKRHEAGLKT
jgi:hypothetical protein